jgi:hypothetical protein
MASIIVITCPECEKELRGPAEFLGKRIRCKMCGHTFTVEAKPAAKPAPAKKPVQAPAGAKAKPAPKKRPPPEEEIPEAEAVPEVEAVQESLPLGLQGDDEGKKPYALTETSLLPRCPQCAGELESEDQIICLTCGYNNRTRERNFTLKTYYTTTGDWIKWLLPGVGCALAALLMVGTIAFLWITWWGQWGNFQTDNWWVLPTQVWGSVICGFIGWSTGKFAFKRLILHTRPPDIIKNR